VAQAVQGSQERSIAQACALDDAELPRFEASDVVAKKRFEPELVFELAPGGDVHCHGVHGCERTGSETLEERTVDTGEVGSADDDDAVRLSQADVRANSLRQVVEVLDQAQGVDDVESARARRRVEEVALEDRARDAE